MFMAVGDYGCRIGLGLKLKDNELAAATLFADFGREGRRAKQSRGESTRRTLPQVLHMLIDSAISFLHRREKFITFRMSSIIDLCRELRRNETQAEKVLWAGLRNRKFLNHKFLRQYPLCVTHA